MRARLVKHRKSANISEPVITDEVCKVSALTADPRNAKKHFEAQVSQIAQSIERFGYIDKIVIRPNGQLVGGEGRLEAIKRLGWVEIECRVIAGLNEAGYSALGLALCDPTKLLQLADAAFDEVTLRVEVLVERVFQGPLGVVRNDGFGASLGDSVANVVGIVSCVGDDELGRRAFHKCGGLRGVALLAGSDNETDWASQSVHGQVNLGAWAASRASDSLILSPPFASLACW
jgi:ParB-like nuclease domain